MRNFPQVGCGTVYALALLALVRYFRKVVNVLNKQNKAVSKCFHPFRSQSPTQTMPPEMSNICHDNTQAAVQKRDQAVFDAAMRPMIGLVSGTQA